MLNLATINPNNNNNNTNTTYSKTLIAFKPRPILLAERNSTTKMTVSTSNDEKITPELISSLDEIILFYLHRNGFSKTLKRFQSEAQIKSDAWKASSVHLEDIFRKYNACDTQSNNKPSKKPAVLEIDEAIVKKEVCNTNEETINKKKKKRDIVESDNGAIKDESEVADKKTVNELETKPKKKKTKNDLDFSGKAEEAKTDVSNKHVDDTINELKLDDSIKKTKDKKKRSVEKEKSEASTTIESEVAQKERKKKNKKKSSTDSDVKDEVNKVKTDTENDSISRKEKTSSKKRKRSLSDENKNENEHENVSTEMTIPEESKRQKTAISKEEKSEKEEITAQEACNQQLDGQTDGKLEINGGEKSGGQKSTKKQRNATAEPKTVNAFQRVKIDQVEFAHEKLQDNSYWAKDGADIGYGAKAQEVLGQVRGRDFRHEKTKKKRGSYRGGLIDLQSHSIKFDYSDED